jgi:hypothetical protein
MPDWRGAGYPRKLIIFVGIVLHSLEKGSFRTQAVIQAYQLFGSNRHTAAIAEIPLNYRKRPMIGVGKD